MARTVRVSCPAKINVFLRVLAREDTGYHQLETLFLLVDVRDDLSVTLGGDGLRLDVSGEDAGPSKDNTVVRAAQAFFAATGRPPDVGMRLKKGIPAGTGLGGASSDAAAALLGLNALHGHPLSDRELIRLGGRIGADVPFFCASVPAAVAWGRGDRLMAVDPPPGAPTVIVVPEVRVSTAVAYGRLGEYLELPASSALMPSRLADWGTLAELQGNPFEAPIFEAHPEIATLRKALEDQGALVARMTGSGSALFGVFEDSEGAERAARAVESVGPCVAFVATTLDSPVGPPVFTGETS